MEEDKNQQEKLEKEFFFTKLDLVNNDHIYAFVEFEEHPVDQKVDFLAGTITILKSNLATTPIYTAQIMSMQCFNKEIEWNFAYFKKIRLSFYRKLKDVKFAFKDPQAQGGKKNQPDDIEYILQNEMPKFRIYFKVQQQADVVAFEIANLKPQIVANPFQYFSDKMSEFCRKKNREVDDLKKERDQERSQKLQSMLEVERLVKLYEHREQTILQKFSLVLNEKKVKIAELKSILSAMEQPGDRKGQVAVKEPQKVVKKQEQQIQQQMEQKVNNKFEVEKSRDEINEEVRQNTLQFLQSQSQMSQSQIPNSKYTGSTYQIDTQHLQMLNGVDEEEEFDVPDPKASQQKNQQSSLYEKQSSLTDLFFS